jgi:DNA-binding CsgD family transcriptional regulator
MRGASAGESKGAIAMTARAADERAFAEVKRLCYAGLDSDTLRRRAAEALRRAVPSAGYCISETDPASGLVVRLLEEPRDPERARHMMQHVFFEGVLDEQRQMAANRISVWRLSDLPLRRPEDDPRYREIYRQRGFRFDLRGLFDSGGERWGGLTLWREHGGPDFADREVALVRRLAPHLAAGLRAAALRERADTGDTPTGGPGVLVLDRSGRVVQHTPAVGRWLAQLGELGPGWYERGELPEAVWAVLGALRHALRTDTEGNLRRVPVVRVRGRSGVWLTLQASLAESAAGRAGETVVVIEPAGPREVSWLRAAGYELSPREREVVDLVARGAPTREIAEALVISEYTVQDHLAHIFEKVGVRSRRELVKRLYLDSLDTR